ARDGGTRAHRDVLVACLGKRPTAPRFPRRAQHRASPDALNTALSAAAQPEAKKGGREGPRACRRAPVLALLVDRQRERDVLARPRRIVAAQAEEPVAAARDRDELPAVDLVYRRNALGRRVELVLPQHLARIAVVRPESSVRRRADEQQAAGRRDRTAARRVAAGARDALRGEGADLAVRDLPFDHALVEVV